MTRFALSTSLIVVLSLFTHNAFAEGRTWLLGLGAQYQETTFIGADDEVNPIPYVALEWGRFELSPLGATYQLMQSQDEASDWGYSLAAFGAIGLGSRDNDDAEIFRDMEDRDNASSIGLALGLGTPVGEIELALAKEVSGGEGVNGSLSYNVPLMASQKMLLSASIGADFMDADSADYSYGVRTSEVTAQRAAYQIDDTVVNPFFSLNLLAPLTPRWLMMAEIRQTLLDDPIVDSSLTTDEDSVLGAYLGIAYRF